MMTDEQQPPAPAVGDRPQLRRLLLDLRGLVALHQELGVDAYPPSARPLLTATGPGENHRAAAEQKGHQAASATPPPERAEQAGPAQAPAAARQPRPELAAVAGRIRACNRCPLQRPRIIVGQGNPEARLLIVAPPPGPAEEAAGLPCQGEAGALLDKMLAAIGLARSTVYLTTVVKCDPPDCRPPTPEESRQCRPWLLEQIAAIRPTLLCTMGQEAAQSLLKSSRNLLQLRGRFHDCQGIALMPTLAPDFLLPNPEMKKAAWHDLQLIAKRLARKP